MVVMELGFFGFSNPSEAVAQRLTESRRMGLARRLEASTVAVISGPSTGSGFVVGRERWIVTNAHVVNGDGRQRPNQPPATVQVRFGNGTISNARVLTVDTSHDLAVLELIGTRAPVPLPLVNSDGVQVGQEVLAYGSPFGLHGTLTEGIVSARRDVPGVGGGMARRLIQTDAPINPGNSGGPLVDNRGRVVGVNTAIFSRTGGSHGIGFAVPANYVKELLDRVRRAPTPTAPVVPTSPALPTSPTVLTPTAPNHVNVPPAQTQTPYVGILGETYRMGRERGVRILSVEARSPAEQSGLRGKENLAPRFCVDHRIPWNGHLILSLDGVAISSVAEFNAKIQNSKPGQEIRVRVMVAPGVAPIETVLVVGAR